MPRYKYDVNTQTKLLDIHKQFQGGLKTVDTDDSLKTLFLRQAENLELSEFGFLEKRYGQVLEKALYSDSSLTSASNLQGYFEYVRSDATVDKILIIDGKLFLSVNGASFTQITNIKVESGKRYPETVVFADLGMDIDDDFYTIPTADTFPTTYIYQNISDLPSSSEIANGATAWVIQNNKPYTWASSTVLPPGTWNAGATLSFDLDLLKVHNSNGNKYYYKQGLFYYEFSQVSGETNTYQFTSVHSPDFADADFQATRPIEAARIDDTLYIFTGTYPIIYRGDGYFYLLDIYEPTAIEIFEFSHNYLENDHESLYRYNRELSTVDNTFVTSGDLIKHIQTTDSNITFDYKPDLPYNTGTGSGFQAQISYQYRNNEYLEQGDFDQFMTNVHDEAGVSSSHIPTSGQILVELFPRVYTRASGGNEDSWIELDKSFYEPEVRSNTDSSSEFDVGSYYVDRLTLQKNYLQSSNRVSITQTTPMPVNITKLPLGEIDLRIELVKIESGYTKVLGGTSQGALYGFEQVEEILFQDDYINLNVTEEKIEDYTDFPKYNNYPDIWSANRVLPHYGKLLVYGSQAAPQNLYISHPKYKGYFPEFFQEEFTTEERDPIIKVAPFQNVLTIMSEDYIWGMKGINVLPDAPAPYTVFTISPLYGTIAPDSVRPVRNYLMFLSKEGVMQLTSLYAVDEQYNVKPADENIRNIVPRVEDSKYDPSKAIAIQFEDQYWLHFPDKEANNENNMVLRYYADTKSWMKDTYFTKQSTDDIIYKGIYKWVRRTGKGLSYISLPYYKNNLWHIDEILLDPNIPSELEYPINAIIETANLEQGYPFHPKNYKEAKLEFSLQNQFNASLAPVFSGTVATLNAEASFKLYKNHKYRFDFGKDANVATFTVTIGSLTATATRVTVSGDGESSHYYEFTFTGDTGDYDIDIPIVGNLATSDTVALSDITYDDKINYYVWIISDDNTLNLDNLESYDASKALNAENLGTRSGTWTFGETDFGNRVTATQTIRLSGKGKNVKLYLEEISKSKWTLESLGFMYKLRRARGNR
ncbi:MAG: hypothetical protein EBY39_03310 [Flavobacteriia bacterium]|nr:hypothetical protein [Flavobacteriia bacterium]